MVNELPGVERWEELEEAINVPGNLPVPAVQ